MKRRIYRMENLALYDYRGVERHLEAMAAKGWRLEHIGAQLWRYRRAEPARVRYAVTYIQDSSQFNPGPTERQLSLEELCAAAGWVKVTDWFQMQIYVSEAESPVPLETEEAVRLEAVHRSMKRNFLPSSVLILLYALVQTGLSLRRLSRDPLSLLENNAALLAVPLFLLLAGLMLFSLGDYLLWYRRSARSVAQGGPCAACGAYRHVNRVSWGILIFWVALYLLWELSNARSGPVAYFALYLLLFCILVFLTKRFTALLRRLKASWAANFALTLAVIVVLSIVMTGVLTRSVTRNGWFGAPRGETYLDRGETWDVSPVSLPLTVSDLTGETYPHTRREDSRTGSILLPQRSCRDTVRAGADNISLSYIISKPCRRLYDWTLRAALHPRTQSVSFSGIHLSWTYTWEEVPAAPWGAEAAYREYRDGEMLDSYLLRFSDRLVRFSAGWTLTPEQTAAVGERLKTA